MKTIRRLPWLLGTGSVLSLLLVTPPAGACTLDSVASLLTNGVPAMRTAAIPRATVAWAPFTVAQAIAAGASVQFAERQDDLARSLPSAMRAAPYRWTFGDGTAVRGHMVTHRYTRPGRYRLTVFGYDAPLRGWYAFDQAVVQVVPADRLLQANLTYLALRVTTTLAAFTWPADALLIVIALLLMARSRRQHRAPAGRSQV